MNIIELAESLNAIERRVLSYLINEPTSVSTISEASGMKEIEVMRGIMWLTSKELAELTEHVKDYADLDVNGQSALKHGFPEKQLLEFISKNNSCVTLSKIESDSGLSKEEVGVSIGALKKKAVILMQKAKETTLQLTDNGKKLLNKESLEEVFIKSHFPKEISALTDEERFVFTELSKRKNIVKTVNKKIRICKITELGILVSKIPVEKQIESLNEEILRSGEWKCKKFRRYDVSAPAPEIYGGKKQHYRRFLDECRSKFLALGFSEMSGPLVESNFWDMDALFMPQFHSARDIHDAYYVSKPTTAYDIPDELLLKVRSAHENGFGTGSSGWKYKFDIEKTKKLLLRTQGTACSVRKLASKNLQNPGKYFAIARVFRYDVIDATHNCDFNQTEGIVIGKGLNIRHLFGLLRMFAKEFADAEDIKVVPSYFPFTEPSVSLYAKHPKLGWIELGGAGIFRPEVTRPLGIEDPVIAWGLGIDRIAMFKLGLNDIRDLFSHDLEFLRNTKVI